MSFQGWKKNIFNISFILNFSKFLTLHLNDVLRLVSSQSSVKHFWASFHIHLGNLAQACKLHYVNYSSIGFQDQHNSRFIKCASNDWMVWKGNFNWWFWHLRDTFVSSFNFFLSKTQPWNYLTLLKLTITCSYRIMN
jgi:hypothetical protein